MSKRTGISIITFFGVLLMTSIHGNAYAGIPGFVLPMIGNGVEAYCEGDMSERDKADRMREVNSRTGNHKVVIVCGEPNNRLRKSRGPNR